MFKVPEGPVAFVDIDDTILMWNVDERVAKDLNLQKLHVAKIKQCENADEEHGFYYINPHNVRLVRDLFIRGHSIVAWSGGGSTWAETVINAVGLQDCVSVITTKPHIYVDDVEDPRCWIGKNTYIDIYGKSRVNYPEQDAYGMD